MTTTSPTITAVVCHGARPHWRAAAAVLDALEQREVTVCEVLVLDDGHNLSPTRIHDVCSALPDHERLRCIFPAYPRELWELRRLAAAEARGEYLAVFDDDDRYQPWRLAHQLDVLTRTGAVAHCFAGWAYYADTDRSELWERRGGPLHLYDATMVVRADLARAHPARGVWASGHHLIHDLREHYGPGAVAASRAQRDGFLLGIDDHNRHRYSLTPPGWVRAEPSTRSWTEAMR